jgi:hypothetical protein
MHSTASRVSSRWRLPWASSCHRKVTRPASRASRRRGAIATRWVERARYCSPCPEPPLGGLAYPPTLWPGGDPGSAATARAPCGGDMAPPPSGRLPCTPDGAGGGTDDGTPDAGHVPGERTWADRPSTALHRVRAHPQGRPSGGAAGGARAAPRDGGPRGTRCPRPNGAGRVPRAGGSRPRPARGGSRSPEGFGARVG